MLFVHSCEALRELRFYLYYMTCSHAFLAKVERLCIPVLRYPRPHIVHEQTGGVGRCLLVLDTDADGTVEMQGRMADLDGRGTVAHHQLRQPG